MKGKKLKPIYLGKSLYLLIPMKVAKLIGVTKDTTFVLTLSDANILLYEVQRRGRDSKRRLDPVELPRLH